LWKIAKKWIKWLLKKHLKTYSNIDIIEWGNISELELKIFLETQIFLVGEVKI